MQKELIIENMKKTNAFYNVSFSPDERLQRFINNFLARNDEIKELCDQYGLDCTKFQERHYRLAMDYLYSQSRCISSAIVGPARFPIEKASKRFDWSLAKLNKYDDYYCNFEKLVKRITRKRQSQDDKKTEWEKKVEQLKVIQEQMKTFNKQCKKDYQKAFNALPEFLQKDLDVNKRCWNMENPYFLPYQLRNNLANIKRLEEQIKTIDRCREIKSGFSFNGGRVEFDSSEIRYNIFFDEIPNLEIRTKIKQYGFKWSPTRKAWTRGAKTISQRLIQDILI